MANDLLNTLDDDFKLVGEFGAYQLLVLVLVGFVVSTSSIADHKFIFIGATPNYRYFWF
jgi:hypothetical protein